ncbi:hypothetical protein QTP88_010531 [Uroleucon formosanum]
MPSSAWGRFGFVVAVAGATVWSSQSWQAKVSSERLYRQGCANISGVAVSPGHPAALPLETISGGCSSIINIVRCRCRVRLNMSRNNIEKVRKYLDESFDSSDYSDQDDSDLDPDFSLQSLRPDSLSRAGPSHTNTGSDTSNESFEVSSSDTDNNDNNNANNNGNDQWYENWEDIPDFQFDNSVRNKAKYT